MGGGGSPPEGRRRRRQAVDDGVPNGSDEWRRDGCMASERVRVEPVRKWVNARAMRSDLQRSSTDVDSGPSQRGQYKCTARLCLTPM